MIEIFLHIVKDFYITFKGEATKRRGSNIFKTISKFFPESLKRYVVKKTPKKENQYSSAVNLI